MAGRITFSPEFKKQVHQWIKSNKAATRVATIEAASKHFKGKAVDKDGKKCADPSEATMGLWYNEVFPPKARKKKAAAAAKKKASPGRPRKTPVSDAIAQGSARLIEQARELEKRIHSELVDGLKSIDAMHDQLSKRMADYEHIFNKKAEDVLGKNRDVRETLKKVGLLRSAK
ncbi:MAG: hypothetical protein GC168_21720 [Candidatus Hydrogenedens sp.]|nr:hypothetical protein [Candidatus Hydrogenedens sp.]